VTWRLHGSLPASAVADLWTTDGPKFVIADRLLAAPTSGPKWLSEPRIAKAVIKNFLEGERRGRYDLGAWVVMPNHVHVIILPHVDLAKIVTGIKAHSARDANCLLGRSGKPFWARDYFDRWIRSSYEEARITNYIEQNPVKAGLCSDPEAFPWCSTNAASAACPSRS
jgi:REP element-mobilizing transposase RayT